MPRPSRPIKVPQKQVSARKNTVVDPVLEFLIKHTGHKPVTLNISNDRIFGAIAAIILETLMSLKGLRERELRNAPIITALNRGRKNFFIDGERVYILEYEPQLGSVDYENLETGFCHSAELERLEVKKRPQPKKVYTVTNDDEE